MSVGQFIHAYKQAPWRVQRQWLGMFLLSVLGSAMIAALYLDVTAQAAIEGRAIQNMSAEMLAVQQANSDLESKLAELTSAHVMEQRAQALGYQRAEADQIEYVIVPGYSPPVPPILASSSTLKPSAPSIPPEYTQSLLEWLNQRLRAPSTKGYSQ